MRRRRRPSIALTVAVGAIVLGGCIYVDPATPKNPPPATPTTTSTSGEGQFINATPWALALWVDVDPVNTAGTAPVVIQPGGTKRWTLERGSHRLVVHAREASASRDERVIGRYDRTIELDPQRAGGWYLRFRESDFR
jgi:hypothetical protein